MKKAIEDSTKGELENVLAKLVEAGRLSAEDISSCLNQIRAATHERLKAAAAFKEKEFQRTRKSPEEEKGCRLLSSLSNILRLCDDIRGWDHSKNSKVLKEIQLSPEVEEALLGELRHRFKCNLKSHEKVEWTDVEKALRANPEKLLSLLKMEITGGRPDILDEENGEFVFIDYDGKVRTGMTLDKEAIEELNERRAERYARNAAEWHTDGQPFDVFECPNATDIAAEFGADLMSEKQFRALENKFPGGSDSDSGIGVISFWLKTPPDLRKSGIALNGIRIGSRIEVTEMVPWNCHKTVSFRTVLRVPKV